MPLTCCLSRNITNKEEFHPHPPHVIEKVQKGKGCPSPMQTANKKRKKKTATAMKVVKLKNI